MTRPRLLRALDREALDRPPIWFMRQAGRCLPEYRALRSEVKDMLALCMNPKIAAEVTLQPMRRFAFDAAVVFADIFLVTIALGQEVWFEAGEGPRLGELPSLAAMATAMENIAANTAYLGETLQRVRAELEPERALIGFAGAPWTLATYMLVGYGGEEGRAKARAIALADPDRVTALVDLLAEATIPYLVMQARAGAQVLQIFESWAEALPEPDLFERLIIQPHARIIEGLRAAGVTAPVIGFPRGGPAELLEPYVDRTGVQAISLGTSVSAELGRRLQTRVAIQGSLDPQLLRAGGPDLDARVEELLEQWGGGPYIFNLGHGIPPDTPMAHIGQVVERITGKPAQIGDKSAVTPRRIAVVLMNLGGPDGPEAVRPFLRNLFSDPAIIAAPAAVRLPLAWSIARGREKAAVANYARMGGASPLLPETQAQAKALTAALARLLPGDEVQVFIAMRYWRPDTARAAKAVAAFAPDEIVLTPLYPQYSTTTTASSLKAWRAAYRGKGAVRALCCWYANEGLARAHAEVIRRTWDAAGQPKVRLLFSAHGVPLRTIAAGDPYQWQVQATCAAVAAQLGDGWDWEVCYQSRVGPLRWLGPSTPAAITAAAEEGLGVLIDPIAFVSEHVETLVELDHDYANLAVELGMQTYLRAPAMGVETAFIEGLAGAVDKALGGLGVTADGARCPGAFSQCGQKLGGQKLAEIRA